MSIVRRLVAETVGTALLLATIVGCGIMAERLSGGNEALTLFCNSTVTGAILIVLISVLGQVSGAHLNPAVTLAFALKREIGAAQDTCRACNRASAIARPKREKPGVQPGLPLPSPVKAFCAKNHQRVQRGSMAKLRRRTFQEVLPSG
jgi:hypothetical protein